MNSREAFEEWWKTHNTEVCITDKDDAWIGWQASRKQLLKELSEKVTEETIDLCKKTMKSYNAWTSMRRRCNSENNKNYDTYGGRGISVCKEWENFDQFLIDMGLPSTRTLSIDRIDNNKGYSKENCRWATAKQQLSNRSCSVLFTFNGKTQTQSEWAKEVGISDTCLRIRIKSGMSIEEALTKPSQRRKRIKP